MKLNISLKTLLSLVWILQVAAETSENDKDTVVDEVYPQARIVGGNFASTNQLPYQVAILANGNLCGGSIISKNYVLTAAHCVEKVVPSAVELRVGSIDLTSGGELITGVSKIIIHKNHNRFNPTNYDIALLKLSKPLTFSRNIKSIALATHDPPEGAAVVVSGFGNTSEGGQFSHKLKYNTLKAISTAECVRRMGMTVQATIICFSHTDGNGTCNGDSGGPAVYNHTLVGLAGYHVISCDSKYPIGFTSVAHLNEWITDNSDL